MDAFITQNFSVEVEDGEEGAVDRHEVATRLTYEDALIRAQYEHRKSHASIAVRILVNAQEIVRFRPVDLA